MSLTTSSTACFYPIVSAIKKANDILGPARVWNPTGLDPETAEKQKYFFEKYLLPLFAEVDLIPEIKSVASFNFNVINKFLADNNFSIRLQPFEKPEDFGTASILDVAVEWVTVGTPRQIRRGGLTFDGFLTSKSEVAFYDCPGVDGPLCELATKSGDIVFMAKLDQKLEGFALMRRAEEILAAAKRGVYNFSGLISPKIKVDEQPDIGWLKKAWTLTDEDEAGGQERYEISQALQQTKIGQNEKGARDKSAVAIGFARTTSVAPRPQVPYVLDSEFIRIVARSGLSKPLTAAWVGTEDWKDPGDLAAL